MSAVESRGTRARLWTGLVAGPLALLWTQAAAYVAAVTGCPGGAPPVHLAHALGLALAAAGTWLAHREWTRAPEGVSDSAAGEAGRGRWMAAAALLTSGTFVLVVIAQWLPAFFLGPCAGS